MKDISNLLSVGEQDVLSDDVMSLPCSVSKKKRYSASRTVKFFNPG